jgi:hypothetical protein
MEHFGPLDAARVALSFPTLQKKEQLWITNRSLKTEAAGFFETSAISYHSTF